jgi:hypothetical protein
MMRNFAKRLAATISLFPILAGVALPSKLLAQVKILTDYEHLTIADGLSDSLSRLRRRYDLKG